MKKSNQTKTNEFSRRGFLKTSACFAIGTLTINNSLASVLTKKGNIALVVKIDDVLANAVTSQWALGELKTSLLQEGAKVRVLTSLSEAQPEEFCVVISAMNAQTAKKVFAVNKIVAPTEAEALVLMQSEVEGREALLVAGVDERGLVYALTELADRVSCLQTSREALEFIQPVIERPASRTRSVMRGFTSEVEDKVWFYDREYWREYLNMLVYSRLNRLNFAMGMGYNSAAGVIDGYFLFPYPFLITVPGHDVRAKGLSAEERDRNLEMLKFIGEECVRRGLLFQLGIWTLAYKWKNSPKATYIIEGLTDATHADYCRDALAVLLKEIPAVSGVTFRVHSESGIPKGVEDFWKTQFSAIKNCGRRVEIEMHFKNMTPETLQHALDTGQPVVLGPKYCGEHLSLPYHQSAIREAERRSADKLTDTGTGVLLGERGFTRYGYGDTLVENRTWDVVFRIWPGTQRFLLNGDPATFAGYGRVASFCGAAGIELSEPLYFKGRRGSGHPGGRLAYSDASLNTRYDFEKYRYAYRLWGRLGYNPDTNSEVWRRSLRQEFGNASLAVEQSLASASRVLTLFTLAHAPSADCLVYLPEIYLNMAMANTELPQPYRDSKPANLFGAVSPFDPQLFLSPDECGDALLDGKATGKYSPLEVAQWMKDIATAITENISKARKQLGTKANAPEFRRVEEDVLIQRGLALFFAGKLRSAVLWRIYTQTGDIKAGVAAVTSYQEGLDSWVVMAKRAEGVYQSDISYGENRALCGHWLDRVPDFDKDLADLRKRLEAPEATPGKYDPAAAEQALKLASSKPLRPIVVVDHTPVKMFPSGQPLGISVRVVSPAPRRVTLYYRHVNQAERWQAVELKPTGSNFMGEIPATYTARRFALQYYFEIETAPTEATLFPPLATDLANVPYFVARRKV